MKKNKIWKRAGAVILSTALLFGTLPTGVMAEETVGQDTNEEELQSKEVVSEDEPAEEILPEEVSSEEDAAEMDYDTAEAESEVSNLKFVFILFPKRLFVFSFPVDYPQIYM